LFRLTPAGLGSPLVGSGYGGVLAGWAGAGPNWANGRDAWVKKKTRRPAGPVWDAVGFRPKILKRIGKLFHFQILI
jgi:hypothetical protein